MRAVAEQNWSVLLPEIALHASANTAALSGEGGPDKNGEAFGYASFSLHSYTHTTKQLSHSTQTNARRCIRFGIVTIGE